jgi:hypothetical protein
MQELEKKMAARKEKRLRVEHAALVEKVRSAGVIGSAGKRSQGECRGVHYHVMEGGREGGSREGSEEWPRFGTGCLYTAATGAHDGARARRLRSTFTFTSCASLPLDDWPVVATQVEHESEAATQDLAEQLQAADEAGALEAQQAMLLAADQKLEVARLQDVLASAGDPPPPPPMQALARSRSPALASQHVHTSFPSSSRVTLSFQT